MKLTANERDANEPNIERGKAMVRPLVRNIEDCKVNDRSMIFFEEECETISVNIVSVPPGEKVEPSSHSDEEEVYIITKGKGMVRLDDDEYEVAVGAAIYIPRDTIHAVQCLSDENFEFVCVSNWPDNNPPMS